MKALVLALLFSISITTAEAAPIDSYIGHFYWGLGQNFSFMGNIRVGFNQIELGLIQGTGFGVMYVQRTASALFMQLGVAGATGGAAFIGGGGLEWNTSSFFRFRTDITVSASSSLETQAYISLGGVFIL